MIETKSTKNNPYTNEPHKRVKVANSNKNFTLIDTKDNSGNPKGRVIIVEIKDFKRTLQNRLKHYSLKINDAYNSHDLVLKSILAQINGRESSNDKITIKNAAFEALMALVAVPVCADGLGRTFKKETFLIKEFLNIQKAKELQWPMDDILNALNKQLNGELKPGDFNIEELLFDTLDGYYSPVYLTSEQLAYLKENDPSKTIPTRNPYSEDKLEEKTFNINDIDDFKKRIILDIVHSYMAIEYTQKTTRLTLDKNTQFEGITLEDIFKPDANLEFGQAYNHGTGIEGKQAVIDFLKAMHKKNDIEAIRNLILEQANNNPGTTRETLFLKIYQKSLNVTYQPVQTQRGCMLVKNFDQLREAFIHDIHYYYMYLSNVKRSDQGFFERFKPCKPTVSDIQQEKFSFREKPGGLENGQEGRFKMSKFLKAIMAENCKDIQQLAELTYKAMVGKITIPGDREKQSEVLDGENRARFIYNFFCQNTLLVFKIGSTENKEYLTVYDYIKKYTPSVHQDENSASKLLEHQEDYLKNFGFRIILQLSGRLLPHEANLTELADEEFASLMRGHGPEFDISDQQRRSLEIYQRLHEQKRNGVHSNTPAA